VVTEAGGLSPLAAGCMENAHGRAARHGGHPAGVTDLLAAIVVDPRSRAVEVLERAGIDPHELFARLEASSSR